MTDKQLVPGCIACGRTLPEKDFAYFKMATPEHEVIFKWCLTYRCHSQAFNHIRYTWHNLRGIRHNPEEVKGGA